jgi:hypothetical protein
MANAQAVPDRAAATPAPAGTNFWGTYGLATFIYLVAAASTRPVFLSDTTYYLTTANLSASEFWDFGHLLWRPFIWLLARLVGGADPADHFLRVFHLLDFLSTVAGLLALWVTVATIRLYTRRTVATIVSAVLFAFAQVMLTYSKGGCAYIFGFLALSLGFYTLLATARTEPKKWYPALIAGGLLALAVCLWFPYIFAVPGTLLAPVLLSERNRKPWDVVLAALMTCAILGLLLYSAVAIQLGIRNVHGFVSWAEASSHGAVISGGTRVVFGLARSFTAVGDGVVFKRFLLRDPYNPVHVWQILGIAFWQILLFYIFLVSVLGGLARSGEGRRALCHLLASSVPVLGFALAWQGSDLERYLPLFPSLMLAIGLGLRNVKFPSPTAGVVCLFVISLVVANLTALSAGGRERRGRELTGTITSLNELLPPESLVLLPPMHQLWRIYWDFPEALPLAQHRLKLQWLVTLGSSDTAQWRTRVCSQISNHWRNQIPVVIESSLLQDSPKQDSAWVEGDDPRVRWRDITAFTSELEIGDRVGNTDFFWIPATTWNVETVDHCR